jgi:ABC-type glycerol-3-phosphate transport system substrate-binding protein
MVTIMPCDSRLFIFSLLLLFLLVGSAGSADPQAEWQKTLQAAKKEGRVVAGGPPTAVLRQKYKETFEKRFGIELELVSAPGPQNAGRAAKEFKAGVAYFDVLHGGSGTLEPLMYENMLALFSDYMILPEVKDPAAMVGRSSVGRQHQNQPLYLFVLCRFFGAAVLQCRSSQAGRNHLLR